MSPEELKQHVMDFMNFRKEYHDIESWNMAILHKKLGGMTTWRNASDEVIYECFIIGEQLKKKES